MGSTEMNDSSFSAITEPKSHQVRGDCGRNSDIVLKAKENLFSYVASCKSGASKSTSLSRQGDQQ